MLHELGSAPNGSISNTLQVTWRLKSQQAIEQEAAGSKPRGAIAWRESPPHCEQGWEQKDCWRGVARVSDSI